MTENRVKMSIKHFYYAKPKFGCHLNFTIVNRNGMLLMPKSFLGTHPNFWEWIKQLDHLLPNFGMCPKNRKPTRFETEKWRKIKIGTNPKIGISHNLSILLKSVAENGKSRFLGGIQTFYRSEYSWRVLSKLLDYPLKMRKKRDLK